MAREKDAQLRRRKGASSDKKEAPAPSAAEAGESKREKKKQYSGQVLRRAAVWMFEKDDASYLALFRIFWGYIMIMEIWGHITHDFSKTLYSFYDNTFHFKFWGLEWMHQPEDIFYMKVFLVVMLFLAIFITIGFFYRTSCILFTIGFIYIYAIEAALYLNHFYLVIIFACLLCIYPANCVFSVDAYLFPSTASDTVPKWVLFSIRTELWIVYTYAGIAKLGVDWLRGEPLRHWLAKRIAYPVVGPLLQYEPAVYFFSYSGMIFDLVIGTLLLFDSTLVFGVMNMVFFHMMNKYIFNIGIFPWVGIATTTLFFYPDWPRLVIHFYNSLGQSRPKPYKRLVPRKKFRNVAPRKLSYSEIGVLVFVMTFLVWQALFPFRHHLYPGDPLWNEHGHRYSWRMKLRDKQCETTLFAYMPDSKAWFEYPVERMLSPQQYQKMDSRPEFLLQFVRHIDEKTRETKNNTIEMYGYTACRVNYRPVGLVMDPHVNLVEKDVWDWPYDFMYDIPAVTEEDLMDLPWNWSWNFNWLFKKWESNIPKLLAQQEREKKEMDEIEKSFLPDFKEFLTKTKFNGNVEMMERSQLHYVDQAKKKELREKSMRGLLLPPGLMDWYRHYSGEK